LPKIGEQSVDSNQLVRDLFQMAKRAAIFPSWVKSLDVMIAKGALVQVGCDTCVDYRQLDLKALREKMGGSYSLVNRRTRCRLTNDCKGWNRFFYLNGLYRPLWDDSATDRWINQWRHKV
jgi:hypothetical protein